jgi:hypothetical protein
VSDQTVAVPANQITRPAVWRRFCSQFMKSFQMPSSEIDGLSRTSLLRGAALEMQGATQAVRRLQGEA